jgi:hypothetical protein
LRSYQIILRFIFHRKRVATPKESGLEPGLPDFSWYNIPKGGKIYQMTTKYTKWPLHISNGRKIDQMNIKCTNIFQRPSKIYPNWDYWFENKPPGIPDWNQDQGCRMVYFHTNLGKFWRALEWKMLVYFMITWNIL